MHDFGVGEGRDQRPARLDRVVDAPPQLTADDGAGDELARAVARQRRVVGLDHHVERDRVLDEGEDGVLAAPQVRHHLVGRLALEEQGAMAIAHDGGAVGDLLAEAGCRTPEEVEPEPDLRPVLTEHEPPRRHAPLGPHEVGGGLVVGRRLAGDRGGGREQGQEVAAADEHHLSGHPVAP